MKPPRIWISNAKPAKGEVVRVRAQIEHPMESGLRTDAAGNVRPRQLISRFEARLGATLLFACEPGISVSPNPYIEFTFLARESGDLVMVWTDEKAAPIEARKAIVLA
jgi:sulfur-oxidizing protein SoxZ